MFREFAVTLSMAILQQQSGRETNIAIDRATAGRLGLPVSQIENTIYDCFGQRQVSTIYSAINQYHVVMECAPQYWQSPELLKDVFVSTAGATPSGTATTNLPAGAVEAKPSTSSHASHSVTAATAGWSTTPPATLTPTLSPAAVEATHPQARR